MGYSSSQNKWTEETGNKKTKGKKTNHDVAEESDDKRGEAVPVHENAAQN